MTAYILDGAVILIFLLAILIGYRRGFVKAVIRLAGCVLALVVALCLSKPLAGGVFDLFFSDQLEQTVSSHIGQTDEQAVREALENILEQLPQPVVNALDGVGLGTPEEITGQVQDALGGTAAELSERIVSLVVRPAAVSLLSALLFLVLFIVCMILVGILASVINKAFQIPVLKQVNGALGAAVGVLEGALLVFVGVTVITLISQASASDGVISREVVERTTIVRTIEKISPATEQLNRLVEEAREGLS